MAGALDRRSAASSRSAVVGAALVVPARRARSVALAVPALVAAVIAAVHHAEVVAHRVGEPFGTLILALAVTVIEVALILSMMLAGGGDNAGAAARHDLRGDHDHLPTARSACACSPAGSAHHEQTFRLEGATSALAALIALATLSLVLPTFTTSAPGPRYTHRHSSPSPAAASLVLWGVFVFVQTVRHRDYFLPPGAAADESAHAAAADGRRGMDELRAAARRAGRGDRPGQGALARDRARRRSRPGRRRP